MPYDAPARHCDLCGTLTPLAVLRPEAFHEWHDLCPACWRLATARSGRDLGTQPCFLCGMRTLAERLQPQAGFSPPLLCPVCWQEANDELMRVPRWKRQRHVLMARGVLCQCGHRKNRHWFHDIGLDFCKQCYPHCRSFRPFPPWEDDAHA